MQAKLSIKQIYMKKNIDLILGNPMEYSFNFKKRRVRDINDSGWRYSYSKR